jgi:hypothetical protein
MTKGIFNPFEKKPKPKLTHKPVLGKVNTESPQLSSSQVTLDGKNFSLIFNNIDSPEKAAVELLRLIYAVNKQYKNILSQNGIIITSIESDKTPTNDEMMLTTNFGKLFVYVGKEHNETAAFRRIAYVLKGLPIKKILDDHKVKILERS